MKSNGPRRKTMIGRQLQVRITIFSACLILLLFSVQLGADYHGMIHTVKNDMAMVNDQHIQSLSAAIWVADENAVNLHFSGIMNIPRVQYVALLQDGSVVNSSGEPVEGDKFTHDIPVNYEYNGNNVQLGTLHIEASKQDMFFDALISAIRMSSIYALMVLIIFYAAHMLFKRRVTRHLVAAADFFKSYDMDSMDSILVLDKPAHGDELDTLVESFNTLRSRLIEAIESANLANTSKSQFLANMSHEIRTPLNGIFGMLQLLKTTPLAEEQKEYVDVAMKSSARLTRLLSDILDISRIEAGKIELVEQEFEIRNLKDSIMDVFSQGATEKGLDFSFDIDPSIPGKVIGDETRVLQVLFNIVGNAIKFTESGYVSIDACALPYSRNGERVILFIIKDSGIGIPDALIHDIFEPFIQADTSFTRRFQGAGLGLFIVRKVLRLTRGEMAIDNVEGQGTTIYVSLPFKLARPRQDLGPEKAESVAEPAAEPVHEPLRILFAEDDKVNSLAGSRMLEKAGHHVRTVENGQQALDLLAANDFDVVFMDIQMPVMDGMEATKCIRASKSLGTRARIPIIAMTAHAMSGDREEFLATGMDDYVAKPMEPDELFAALGRVLANHSVSSA